MDVSGTDDEENIENYSGKRMILVFFRSFIF